MSRISSHRHTSGSSRDRQSAAGAAENAGKDGGGPAAHGVHDQRVERVGWVQRRGLSPKKRRANAVDGRHSRARGVAEREVALQRRDERRPSTPLTNSTILKAELGYASYEEA